jgi:hypothetical protein
MIIGKGPFINITSILLAHGKKLFISVDKSVMCHFDPINQPLACLITEGGDFSDHIGMQLTKLLLFFPSIMFEGSNQQVDPMGRGHFLCHL